MFKRKCCIIWELEKKVLFLVSFIFSNSTFLKQSIGLQGILQTQGFPFQQDGFQQFWVPGTSVSPTFPLLLSFAIQQFEHAWGNIKRGHVQSDPAQLPQALISTSALLTKPGLGHADWDRTGMEWGGWGIIDWNGENVIKWEREQERFFSWN